LVTLNDKAVKGSAYNGPLNGNVLALQKSGDNPLDTTGHLKTLSFMWKVDPKNGPTFTWFVADGNPVGSDGTFKPSDQIDVLVNRVGTDPLVGGITGDGSGTISFETTPFWPGSLGNSPPLTLYKGWDGKNAYGYQGFYKIQGNVKGSTVGIHDGPISAQNPTGLGIVPKFDGNGKAINGTIDQLYEPLLCSMLGNWADTNEPFPWSTESCQNPPPGSPGNACPRTGAGPVGSYDNCWVDGATRPGVGWWSNSPLAAGAAFAPFDPTQNWNIILNVAIGGQWPRAAGQEGVPPGQNFVNMADTNLRMKSIKYYEVSN